MTREELDSFSEFRGLAHYNGDDMDLQLEKPPAGFTICSAMEVSEAREFLADERTSPKWIEYHTADSGEVGYEVVFWRNERGG